MKVSSKLRAYTLSELVVVLVITAIVAGIAFMALRLVQKHMSAINANFNKTTEFHKLEQALWIDFHKSETVYFNREMKELQFDSVVYMVESPYIIRDKDTFDIGLNKVDTFFNGELLESDIDLQKIDAVKITTDSLSGSKALFVFKENDATDFMN